MQLKIYTQTSARAPVACFRVESGSWSWSSPAYPDQASCVEGLKALLLRLRTYGQQADRFVVKKEEGYELDLLGDALADYESPSCATQAVAEAVLKTLYTAAQAEVFQVAYFSIDLEDNSTRPVAADDTPAAGERKRDSSLIDNYFIDRVQGPKQAGVSRFSAEIEESQQYFFQISDADCQVLLYSEGYESEAGRDKGLMSVLRNLNNEAQYDFCTNEEEAYFFRILAKNHQEIARSRYAPSREALDEWVLWLRRQAPRWVFDYAGEEDCEPGEDVIITIPEEKSRSTKEVVIIPPPVRPVLEPCGSLFNLLRPFGKEDVDRYFGREHELEEIYQRLFDSRLFVLHGEQATGKTSLVQCGLANRLRETRWDMILVRRWDNLNNSLKRQLRERAREVGCEDLSPDCGAEEALQQIYDYSFRSTLLVFDQLEELFMPPISVAEQHEFFFFIQRLIQNPELPCKVLLLLRDQQLAALADYEAIVPTLLEHRYHLRHLPATQLGVVVDGLLTNLVTQGLIEVPDPTAVTAKIKDKLAGNKPEVGLACTQIYLHETHCLSCSQARNGLPLFTPSLIEEMGSSAEVTERYVTQRIAELEAQLPKEQGAELTAVQAKEIEELVQLQNYCGCPEASPRSAWLAWWHQRGKDKMQLQNLLWLALLGMVLGALALGFTYCQIASPLEPCEQVQQSGSCEDWLNQYCQEKKSSTCAEELRARLDEENCAIWVDYQTTLAANTCDAFGTYVRTYREEGLCADYFYELMRDRGCIISPDSSRRVIGSIIRDTILIYDTIRVHDTIRTRAVPPGFNKIGQRIPGPACDIKDGTSVLQLGPLLLMTEDLENGRSYTWVEALDACRRKGEGWRLPCANEIDFILERHYDSPRVAFSNLTTGSCSLYDAKPGELSGKFWTSTEANDATGWAIYFDIVNREVKTIYDVSKTTSLPCRCVYRLTDVPTSMKPCLDKEIRRGR